MKTAVKHQNKNIDKQEITATKVKEDYIFLPFFTDQAHHLLQYLVRFPAFDFSASSTSDFAFVSS